MRLADLGARVIKIERPGGGDIGRQLAFAGRVADGDTISFHAMNRNKEGVTADLKNADDLARVKELITHADVLIQNFRPGVMERIGLDYESVKAINPGLIYGSASGYGDSGPWRDRPGQDLLAQSVSGLPWLSGGREAGPVPVGLSIADHLTSCHLAQGITALLVRKARTGLGGLVQTSLLEAMLDLQFELLSTHLNDATVTVARGGQHSAHAFLPAPYGTYPTSDGYLALAMNPIDKIGTLLEDPYLSRSDRPAGLVGRPGRDRGAAGRAVRHPDHRRVAGRARRGRRLVRAGADPGATGRPRRVRRGGHDPAGRSRARGDRRRGGARTADHPQPDPDRRASG